MYNFRFLSFFILAASLFYSEAAPAQDRPVGNWRAHYPYTRGYGVATDGNAVFAATGPGFFTYNPTTGERDAFSKVEGMSDVDTRRVAYDAATNTVVIAYANSNIDLFHPADGSFRNLPDLRLKSVNGSKEIRSIYTENGLAYLSTDIGIIVLNLARQEVRESYVFSQNSQTIPVTSFASLGSFFYAATPQGLYRAPRNSNSLQFFNNWQLLPGAASVTLLSVVSNRLYAAGSDSLFQLQSNGSLSLVYRSGGTTRSLDAGASKLYVSKLFNINNSIFSRVYVLDAASNTLVDSFGLGLAAQIAEQADGTVWVADEYQGIGRRENGVLKFDAPSGPFAESAYDILPYNRKVWVAHGSHADNYGPRGNAAGISVFENEGWRNFRNDSYRWVFGDSVYDVVNLAINPNGDGTLYAGTIEKGLIEIKPDLSGRIYKQGYIPQLPGQPVYPVSGLAFDKTGNLWMVSNFAPRELTVRTTDGQFFSVAVPQFGRAVAGAAFSMLIDDYNQKWYLGLGGGGVIVYNDNNTPTNASDDGAAQLRAGKDAGNLPSSTALCLAKDREGAIWIGTDNGIGIVSCPGNVIAGTCAAELRVVKYDQFAGELFKGEVVRSIAVDGANRKWIGTGNGVWLITADANKIVYRFTAENSPLPSNFIQKIAVDPITGDVYFGTDKGMVSFRSTATDGNVAGSNLVTFPNPVPAGYTGTVAIRGFTTDADVRITDIAGNLVFRTKALGGQAAWNGLDYKGHRPQTGVYLVYASNRDGSETQVGKFLLYE